jgi:hypothetical protein
LVEYFGHLGARKPDEIIDVLASLLLAVPLSAPVRSRLVDICGKNSNLALGIGDAMHAMAALPEFQLS